jgi:hypothetical protein
MNNQSNLLGLAVVVVVVVTGAFVDDVVAPGFVVEVVVAFVVAIVVGTLKFDLNHTFQK